VINVNILLARVVFEEVREPFIIVVQADVFEKVFQYCNVL